MDVPTFWLLPEFAEVPRPGFSNYDQGLQVAVSSILKGAWDLVTRVINKRVIPYNSL